MDTEALVIADRGFSLRPWYSEIVVYLRTPEEKADPVAWWGQPDEVFFSAGACHILASVYISMHPEFSALMIKPLGGHRGGHVVAVGGDDLFDPGGLKAKVPFIQGYFAEMQSRWNYKAPIDEAVLLPVEERTFHIPKGRGGMGQSMIVYAIDSKGELLTWAKDAFEYMASYSGANLLGS